MTKKKSFVLRIDPEMYGRVEKWAADEFRSTNGHIEWIINEALKKAGRKPFGSTQGPGVRPVDLAEGPGARNDDKK